MTPNTVVKSKVSVFLLPVGTIPGLAWVSFSLVELIWLVCSGLVMLVVVSYILVLVSYDLVWFFIWSGLVDLVWRLVGETKSQTDHETDWPLPPTEACGQYQKGKPPEFHCHINFFWNLEKRSCLKSNQLRRVKWVPFEIVPKWPICWKEIRSVARNPFHSEKSVPTIDLLVRFQLTVKDNRQMR